MSGPDYIVDIQGLAEPSPAASPRSLRGRPWLAVHWKCCSVYSRLYRNPEGTAYAGRCPSCSRPINLRVGPGGTSCRFFEAQ